MPDVTTDFCPLCGSEASLKKIEAGAWTTVVCPNCLRFSISKRALESLSSLPHLVSAEIKMDLSHSSRACPDDSDFEVFTEPNSTGTSEIRHRLRNTR